MSRAVLAVMAGLLCALAGIRRAAALKGDALRLHRWVQLLRHLTLLLRQGTMSIPEALCAAADGMQAPDRLLRNMATALQASPLLSLAEAYRQCSEPCTEQYVLLRLFGRMGHGSQDSRCLALEQATEELRLMESSAAEKATKDAKLWQTLGLTGGICLTIILL